MIFIYDRTFVLCCSPIAVGAVLYSTHQTSTMHCRRASLVSVTSTRRWLRHGVYNQFDAWSQRRQANLCIGSALFGLEFFIRSERHKKWTKWVATLHDLWKKCQKQVLNCYTKLLKYWTWIRVKYATNILSLSNRARH